MTVSEIEHRAGRGGRRRTAAWAAATATAVLVGGLVMWPKGPAGDPPPAHPSPSASAAAWRATFADDCARKWDTMDRGKLGADDRLPPLRLEAATERIGIRVYADDRVIADCEHTASGSIGTGFVHSDNPARALMPDTGADIPRYGSITHLGEGPAEPRTGSREADEVSADYYVGRVPAGVTRIDAVSPDGRVIEAAIDGDLFLLWAPEGGLHGSLVRAYSADRLLVTSGLRYEVPAREGPVEPVCRAIAAQFTARGGVPALPPLRFTLPAGEDSLHVYTGVGMAAVCRARKGEASLTSVGVAAGSPAWQPLWHAADASWGSGWIVGLAPAGATGGTVQLAGGRTVPLRFSGGWFAARWDGAQGDVLLRPERIEVNTATGVWTSAGDTVSHRPR